MALIALSAIGVIDYLGYGTIFMCEMFQSVVSGRKKCFFSRQKSPRSLLGGGAGGTVVTTVSISIDIFLGLGYIPLAVEYIPQNLIILFPRKIPVKARPPPWAKITT
jgi:hypothetical protein